MASDATAVCPPADEVDFLITAERVAERLELSKRTVSRLDASGKLPAPVRIGGSVRWSSEEISQWIKARCPDRATWERMNKASGERGGR
jgi:excisionase family DNA binding protein